MPKRKTTKRRKPKIPTLTQRFEMLGRSFARKLCELAVQIDRTNARIDDSVKRVDILHKAVTENDNILNDLKVRAEQNFEIAIKRISALEHPRASGPKVESFVCRHDSSRPSQSLCNGDPFETRMTICNDDLVTCPDCRRIMREQEHQQMTPAGQQYLSNLAVGSRRVREQVDPQSERDRIDKVFDQMCQENKPIDTSSAAAAPMTRDLVHFQGIGSITPCGRDMANYDNQVSRSPRLVTCEACITALRACNIVGDFNDVEPKQPTNQYGQNGTT